MHGLPSTTPCPALLLRFPASAAPTSRRGYVRSPPQAASRVGRIASLPSASVARPPSAALPSVTARGLAQLDGSRECSAGMPARPLDRRQKMGPHEHAPVLVADEGEAVCLPLIGPWPRRGLRSVGGERLLLGEVSRGAARIDRSPIPGRPITVNVVLALVLLGLAGSVTDVLIVVRAAPAHRCPSDQLTMPALPHHPADPGPDQHAD